MKTGFLLFTLLVAGFSAAQTNVYHPFPASDAIWHIHEHPQGGSNIHYQYGIIGDTVLNGLSWHKLYREDNCLQDPVMTTANSVLVGALREDASKRVFFYSINYTFTPTDSTYLLYDFSLNTGDTIHYTYPNPELTVDSIDSVLTVDQYRKCFHMSSSETWIEGIGNLRDVLSPVTPYPLCDCLHELFCFRQENLTCYLRPGYSDCYDLDMGLSENNLSKGMLFPNPSIAAAAISLAEPAINASLEVYDLQGKIIRLKDGLNGKTIGIQLDGLHPGMYLVRLTQNRELLLEEKLLLENR